MITNTTNTCPFKGFGDSTNREKATNVRFTALNISSIESKQKRSKLQEAADAVTDQGFTVPKAAEAFKVDEDPSHTNRCTLPQ